MIGKSYVLWMNPIDMDKNKKPNHQWLAKQAQPSPKIWISISNELKGESIGMNTPRFYSGST